MCLLSYFPPGVQPDCAALFNGTLLNNDGHGFAIVSGARLIIRRGLRADDMVDTFGKLRRKYPDGPALFHSRFGTGGANSLFNCHPFHFRGDRRTVVAHNGILPDLLQPTRKDKRCDTRIAAEEVFPSGFGHLNARDNRDRLAAWIGPRNKLVILTLNPAYDEPAYLINDESGKWDGGIWYSNRDYLPLNKSYASRDEPEPAAARCLYCDSDEGVDVDGCCVECGLCVDCAQPWADCQCFIPRWSAEGLCNGLSRTR